MRVGGGDNFDDFFLSHVKTLKQVCTRGARRGYLGFASSFFVSVLGKLKILLLRNWFKEIL